MCNLDLIADDRAPIIDSQGQLWLQWFFRNVEEADFVVALVIFGAVFLMAVSVIALFAVMLLKDRFPKKKTTEIEPDGSVHIVPFLICIVASIMFIFAVIVFLAFWFMPVPYLNLYYYFTLPYDLILIYIAAIPLLFSLVLRYSPNGSRLFRGWNRVCRNISLVVLCAALTVIAFGYCFYWFTLL